MRDHLKALGLLYILPFKAVSVILDRGRLGWALALAVLAGLLALLPSYLQRFSLEGQALDVNYPVQTPGGPHLSSVLMPLLVLAVIFVPVAVIVINFLESTGSASVVLPRDYMPMLACHLMASVAAALPVAVFEWIPGLPELVILLAGGVYFLFLSMCVVRTLSGAGPGRSLVATLISAAAAAAGVYLYSFLADALYFLASPFVLFYLYILFGQGIGSGLRGFGGGLNSRQRMRQLLEISSVNPRDADARYQLGLIYQQRRDYEQAKKCFEEALAIDPKEPEAQYQLGRVLRAQGQIEPALSHLKAAAAIDNKVAQSEVLRETGAALLELGRSAEARDILREYTNRHSFDAEGNYWYGVALSRSGDIAGAKETLKQAIEAVRTAPSHLRRQAGRWESAARKQLRQL